MYIKTLPRWRMFVASNHNEFNAAMNRVAGTKGVAYSQPWDMSTRSGRTYMSRAYDTVGRIYADTRLNSSVPIVGKLSDNVHGTTLAPMQKVALSAMRNSENACEFESAVHAAVKHGAINHAAAAIFSRPAGVCAIRAPAAAVAQYRAGLSDVEAAPVYTNGLRKTATAPVSTNGLRQTATAPASTNALRQTATAPVSTNALRTAAPSAVRTTASLAEVAPPAVAVSEVASDPMEIAPSRPVHLAERNIRGTSHVAPSVKRRKRAKK